MHYRCSKANCEGGAAYKVEYIIKDGNSLADEVTIAFLCEDCLKSAKLWERHGKTEIISIEPLPVLVSDWRNYNGK